MVKQVWETHPAQPRQRDIALQCRIPSIWVLPSTVFDTQACASPRAKNSNPKGPKNPKNLHETVKEWYDKKEEGYNSYLVQTAREMIRRISRDQLMKVEVKTRSEHKLHGKYQMVKITW